MRTVSRVFPAGAGIVCRGRPGVGSRPGLSGENRSTRAQMTGQWGRISQCSCSEVALPKTETKPSKNDPRYEPTKAELEEDLRIDATPEELIAAMFGRHPRRVTH